MSSFIHLHNHTHFSLLDSISTPEGLVDYAIKNNQDSIALTDHGVMFGSLGFYKYAKSKGIKPIIGVEAYMANGDRFEKDSRKLKKRNYFHVVLLAKNLKGYQNLLKLVSAGYTEGFYYKPRIDRNLLAKHSEGLICLSACLGGVVSAHIIEKDWVNSREAALYYKELFKDDFYLEIQDHKLPQDPLVLDLVPKLAKELQIPLVCTNDIHYLDKSHAIAHNVLLLIQSANAANSGKEDVTKLRYQTDEFYFKSSKEMIDLFKDFPDAISNTLEIAKKCDVTLDLKTNHMPQFPIPQESKANDLNEYLVELVYKGLQERYPEINAEIKSRADYELEVIINMGFPGYFLIVWDFIRAAREINVSVGPGRGSAAGSLVAYALKITNVDPLKYGLLFERFLNPERVSMPDIDIDFADDKRGKVIEYVKDKYGEKSVAMISTYGKLAPKAALTDVGRVLGVPLDKIKRITKEIPVIFGKPTPLKDAFELPEIKKIINEPDPLIPDLTKYALLLEGKLRNLGTHAAGVVIAPSDVTDYVPICTANNDKDNPININTQYSMKDLESAGLIKMDFLGLRTLSIIDNTLSMVKENYNIEIDIDAIDLYDPKTYDMLGEGLTLAVFQFESDGMQEAIKKLKPKDVEELTALNALYRPGPMKNIPLFIDRKFGRAEIKYLHPDMEEVLKNTYGIIVYQEQVMQLVQKISKFTLGTADIVRRAMGKKDEKLMQEQVELIAKGAMENGVEKKTAFDIGNLILEFANYGFNKSHALAYSYLAYQTAWLKAHYPAEFIAANMTAEIDSPAKVAALREEAAKFNIKVIPPDVNLSRATFFAQNNTIYYGLAGVKNVGFSAVESIIKAREEKKFDSFFDFCARVDTRLINKRTLEMLVKVGAFDSISEGKRAALFYSIDIGIEYAKAVETSSKSETDSLFLGDMAEESEMKEPELEIVEEWTEDERLRMEKEVMNFYVSGHPLFKYSVIANSLSNCSTVLEVIDGEVINKPPQIARICGIITEIRKKKTRDNSDIAFVTIEDLKGKVECAFWKDEYKQNAHNIELNKVVMVNGNSIFEKGESTFKINAKKLLLMEEALLEYAKGFKIWLDMNDESHLNLLDELNSQFVKSNSGRDKLVFNVRNKSENYARQYIREDIKLSFEIDNISYFAKKIGENNIRLIVS